MFNTIEVSNRAPVRRGNRKLGARNLQQALRRQERIAPNLARNAEEFLLACKRREKVSQPAPAPLPVVVVPDAPWIAAV